MMNESAYKSTLIFATTVIGYISFVAVSSSGSKDQVSIDLLINCHPRTFPEGYGGALGGSGTFRVDHAHSHLTLIAPPFPSLLSSTQQSKAMTLPSLASIYLRAVASVVKSKTLAKGVTSLDPLSLRCVQLPAFSKSHIANFRGQVGSTVSHDFLPSSYLQVKTMSMPMSLLSQTPLNILGSLHESCTIKSERLVKVSETLTATAVFDGNVEKSDKDDILLSITVTINDADDSTVQTIKNKYRILNPKRHKIKSAARPPAPSYEGWSKTTKDFPVTVGKDYAMLNGDVNPIHMTPLTAKLFGYSSCIAHGMFSVCTMFGLEKEDTGKQTISGLFVRPMMLPRKKVTFLKSDNKEGNYVVGYYDKEGKFKACVEGQIE
jgi:hypothetical protein